MDDLLAVMLEARRLIARPENDFTWSSFIDQEAALFLPTGPIQEVSLSSGWGDEFVALADRFDLAAVAHSGRAKHLCALCGKEAGTLTCADGELRRVSAAPARVPVAGRPTVTVEDQAEPRRPDRDRFAPCGGPCTGGCRNPVHLE